MTSDCVVTVGAYERENFGDLLFLLCTRAYMKGLDLRACAPFDASTESLIGMEIDTYRHVVESVAPRAVWVVGGEVGGVSLEYGYKMSCSDLEYSEFGRMAAFDRERFLSRRTALPQWSSAYMPAMSAFSSTFGSASVINSVGLRSVGKLVGARRREAFRALREANHLSVRDRSSSRLLRLNRVNHVLAPDLVHTLPLLDIVTPQSDRYVLLQIREEDLSDLGPRRAAEVIVSSEVIGKFPVRLFTAGSARSHDSRLLYEEVIYECGRLASSLDIGVSTAKSPIEKAAEVAGASLWIGTSLHGYIVATAYGVPRVGLKVPKVTRYAGTWSDPMPFDVPFDEVSEASVHASRIAGTNEVEDHRRLLEDLARKSVTAAVDVVESWPESQSRLISSRLRERTAFGYEGNSLKIRLGDGMSRLMAKG
ncbi:polysaccharide pyruvyl transferase family protein [Gordonia sp. NPDC003376]